jgi:osmotically-inducible protein OsmY
MRFLQTVFAFFPAVLLLSMVSCASTPQKDGASEYPDNAAITSKVRNALFREPTLKGAEINVEARQGVVQLSGIVDSRAEMQRAVEVASNVDGVTSVSNDIQLR